MKVASFNPMVLRNTIKRSSCAYCGCAAQRWCVSKRAKQILFRLVHMRDNAYGSEFVMAPQILLT